MEGLIWLAVLVGSVSIGLYVLSKTTKVSDGYGGERTPAPMQQTKKVSKYGIFLFILIAISVLCALSQEVMKLWQSM